jgi:ABC-2 type transport system permease protein
MMGAIVHNGHGHGARPGVLIIVLIVVGIGFVVARMRRRDRRTIDVAVPAVAVAGAAPHTGSIALNTPIPSGHYRLGDLVRSEWTKLRSVQSTISTLVVTVVLGLGVSAIATAETRAHWSSMSISDRMGFDPISTSLIGIFIAQFSIGVLGVMAMSGEYASGTIRSTFTAAPHRLRVLAAKVLVFSVLALVISEIVSFASFFLGQALLTSPAAHATLSSPGALRAVAGCGLYVALLGIMALGLATMVRYTAAALSTFVGILLIAPLVVQALPSNLAFDIRRFLPDRIGVQIINVHSSFPGAFSPWVGMAILAGYAVAANVIGAILLMRRDA